MGLKSWEHTVDLFEWTQKLGHLNEGFELEIEETKNPQTIVLTLESV